jgi:hypothetical protein
MRTGSQSWRTLYMRGYVPNFLIPGLAAPVMELVAPAATERQPTQQAVSAGPVLTGKELNVSSPMRYPGMYAHTSCSCSGRRKDLKHQRPSQLASQLASQRSSQRPSQLASQRPSQ